MQNTATRVLRELSFVQLIVRQLQRMSLRVALVGLLLSPGLLLAEPLDSEQSLGSARSELAALQEQLDETAGNTLQARRQISVLRKRLVTIRSQARDCISNAVTRVTGLTERREALGEPSGIVDPEILRSHRELDAEIDRNEKARIACEQITQASQDLFNRIQQRDQAALMARLFARGLSTPQVMFDAFDTPRAWSRIVSGFLAQGSGWERLPASQHWIVLLVIVVLLAAGSVWRRRWFLRHGRDSNSRYLVAAAPWLLACIGGGLTLTALLPEWPPALVIRLVLGILVWLIFDVLLHIWLAGRVTAGLAEVDAKTLSRWLRILAGLLILGSLLTTAESVIQLPDPHYFLLRTVMAGLLLASLVWSAIILGRVPGLAGTRTLRVLMVLAALVVAVAETLGYRNLSIHLLLGFCGTVIGFGVAGFTARSFTFLFDGLDEGRYPWQKSVRKLLDLKARELVPGLIWLRLAASLLVWSAFAVWVLWVWGQSERWIGRLGEYVTEGFDVGSLHIAPTQILGAIAVLAVGISLTRWVKQNVITDLVKRTRLDRGGREAMVTVSGYTGVMLSFLIALGVAGISYTNLAIVAGALSVGIGFGLQNVVNNFVSGLILLFERPVRTGDWVVVGDTQGYVRKISIRSTQIETFDRADVIVPNSELIANKVSNWMLRDPWGRIKIPVGVAYGSDVAKVIEILLAVANEQEGVMKDQAGISPPKVLFRQFGDSALEFELRCFIRNIDRMLDITSNLNIAIDKAFREAGITIPFPQRDVHVKTLPRDSGTQDS